jgi:uncharacterized membrane protein
MKKLAGLLVLLAATSSAYAGGSSGGGSGGLSGLLCQVELMFGLVSSCPASGGSGGSGPVSAPEMDATSAIAGLTLAVGGLLVLRGRRIQKTEV